MTKTLTIFDVQVILDSGEIIRAQQNFESERVDLDSLWTEETFGDIARQMHEQTEWDSQDDDDPVLVAVVIPLRRVHTVTVGRDGVFSVWLGLPGEVAMEGQCIINGKV